MKVRPAARKMSVIIFSATLPGFGLQSRLGSVKVRSAVRKASVIIFSANVTYAVLVNGAVELGSQCVDLADLESVLHLEAHLRS